MKRASAAKTVHDPVVKSCSRVPTATTTSASAASALADAHPVTPTGPAFNGWRRDEARLARHRLDDRDVVPLGERRERGLGPAVVHTATGDDERPFRGAQQRGRAVELAEVGARPGDRSDRRSRRTRPGSRTPPPARPGAGRGRPARRWPDRASVDGVRQRVQQLLGSDDAVPVANDRLERVVDRDRRIAEVLDLLQHRIGDATGERVAGEQQHRQTVGVRDAGCRHHVERARPDRGGGHHDLPAPHGLRVADRGERHPLLVLTAPRRAARRRPPAAHGPARSRCRGRRSRTHRGTAARRWCARQRGVPGQRGALGDEVSDERLRGGEANRLHGPTSSRRETTSSHRPLSHERSTASCTLTYRTASTKPGVC